jgi:putative Mg2+ transporter-C (MgtC) family protein
LAFFNTTTMQLFDIPITFQLWILLDVVIACILGGILGIEREKKEKPAGFRTNMFIAGASALLLSLGRFIANSMELELDPAALGVDPTRIIHAIIVGVSFIGAGTILKSSKEETVRYLTTAAMILFSAGAGISVALKLYVVAVGVTIIGLLINTLVKRVYG